MTALSSLHQWKGGSWPLSRQKMQNLQAAGPLGAAVPSAAVPSSLPGLAPPALPDIAGTPGLASATPAGCGWPGAAPLLGLGGPATGTGATTCLLATAAPSGAGAPPGWDSVRGIWATALARGAGTAAPALLNAAAAVPVSGGGWGTGATAGRATAAGATTTGLDTTAAAGLTSAAPPLATWDSEETFVSAQQVGWATDTATGRFVPPYPGRTLPSARFRRSRSLCAASLACAAERAGGGGGGPPMAKARRPLSGGDCAASASTLSSSSSSASFFFFPPTPPAGGRGVGERRVSAQPTGGRWDACQVAGSERLGTHPCGPSCFS